MPLRYAIALLLLTVVPLVVIGWLGSRVVARQNEQQRAQLQRLMRSRLDELDQRFIALSRLYQTQLTADLSQADRNVDSLRDLRRQSPLVHATMLVDRDGRLIYPERPATDASHDILWHAVLSELARRRPIGADDDSHPADDRLLTSILSRKLANGGRSTAKQPPRHSRWQTCYHDNGLQLALWLPRDDQSATGVVLERGRWMADLIQSVPDSGKNGESFALHNSDNETVYRWGDPVPDDDAIRESVRMSAPWSSWSLSYALPESSQVQWPTAPWLPLAALLISIVTCLSLLGIYLMTAMQRQMALAQQQVSFASHVSHELRTPLTNIRLYTDLARRDLAKSKESPMESAAIKRLDVIEEESRRLSRIVSGVLEMVSGKNKLRLIERVPDEVIRTTIESFLPSLQHRQIRTDLRLNASRAVQLDEDLLDIVLVNLISNVEKYAGQGGRLEIRSTQTTSETIIDIIDDGPGIPRSSIRKVFAPFQRLDDSLESPAGTGLGLAIARNAARRHGGDLVYVTERQGAHFRLTLRHGNQVKSNADVPTFKRSQS
ncbi:sensor histidine kinase [Crateriforma spongiae]|uniref:sensor histidine kinase n=1 Tax=Crateriforma spongiae TaxID=2724528 RepID=UPI001448078E|nr:HAMP domain-containing sensor histidine kinase [Crateriforma spongiae]